jgi:Ni,Fe-hydrogenase III small subunit
MKEKEKTLQIFNFSHSLINTELLSLLGNKYHGALPFSWEFTTEIESSDVILWDGVITPKNNRYVEKLLSESRSGKILLLLGESRTLFQEQPGIKLLNIDHLNIVELPGWNALPEEILSSFYTCYKKLKNV